MSTFFKDSLGTSWELAINLGSAIKIKDRLGVDILQPESGEKPLYQQITEDDQLFGKIISVLLENQFDKHSVTEDNIFERFDGATIKESLEALNKELISFFQSRGRPDRAKQIQKVNAMLNEGIKVQEEQVDQIPMDQLIGKMRKEAHEAFTKSVGSLVE